MRDTRPSFTAAFVAACRGLGVILPRRARIVEDPFGARFAGPLAEAVARAAASLPAAAPLLGVPLWPLVPWIVYMQVRTRALDDVLLGFVAGGGRQVVILGAGFDARAARYARELEDVLLVEVDHPATQARKRAVLDEMGAVSRAHYLKWNFEREPLSALPARLCNLGHDPTRPTLTLWEGVTMYLSQEAIGTTVAAVSDYSAAGSLFAFNYVPRELIEHPSLAARAIAFSVRGVGEGLRFGWNPAELPGWLDERGFALAWDRSFGELAREMLPAPWGELCAVGERRLAVAERIAVAARTV